MRLWIPALSMLLVSLISYIDRNTLAILSPTILRETGLSAEQYGFIISGFSVAYMIGNPVWGRLLDRFGLRTGMFAAVSLWTAASAAHALANGFWSFTAARAALGFGEGATFPGGLRTSLQTLPLDKQSRGVAVSYSGGSLGAMVTPLIVTPIALWWGWRGAFLFTGLIGAAWLAMWFFLSRRPEIARQSVRAGPPPSLRWTDSAVWSLVASYALCALPLGFILYYSALYLNRVLGVSQAGMKWVLWIPPAGWEFGYFFWGWVLDRSLRSNGDTLPVYRRIFTVLLVCSLPMVCIPYTTVYPLILFLLFFEMMAASGFVIVSIRYATQIYSPSHAGLIAGIGAGSWGATVALMSPVFGRLFDRQQWDIAFLLAAAFPPAGYLIWLALNRRRAMPPEESLL